VNRAIQIDPTYDKAHYRRLQLLRDMHRLDEAIEGIEGMLVWIKNEEI